MLQDKAVTQTIYNTQVRDIIRWGGERLHEEKNELTLLLGSNEINESIQFMITGAKSLVSADGKYRSKMRKPSFQDFMWRGRQTNCEL